MEQLVIFLLFVVASIVSSVIQNKKKKAEEEAARRDLSFPPVPASAQHPPSPPPVQRPISRWPRSAQDWQEQLRKMVEDNLPPEMKPKPPGTKPVIKPVIIDQKKPTPPPVRGPVKSSARPIPTKILLPVEKSEGDLDFKNPLRESATAFERASKLHVTVEDRLRSVDQQTASHRPSSIRRDAPGSATNIVRNLRRRPSALREAFVVSLVFAVPKSLEDQS